MLRQVYMGEPLGHTGASRDTTRNVREHSYRACVVMGIQPRRAGGLLRDADGGTPQRVLWLPVTYPGMPDPGHMPEPPDVFKIRLPRDARNGTSLYLVRLPETAKSAVGAARLARGRGETIGGMDGHVLLTREKAAAALALMDGERSVSPSDWAAAGVIIDLSTETRELCREACDGVEVERATERRRINAEAEDIVEDGKETQYRETVRSTVLRMLSEAQGIPVPFRQLHRQMSGRKTRYGDRKSHRDRLNDVLPDLVDAALILESETVDGNGDRTTQYSLPRS